MDFKPQTLGERAAIHSQESYANTALLEPFGLPGQGGKPRRTRDKR